jgi:cytochrome P450
LYQVIRVGPNEISYVTPDAWIDIYKAPRGQEQLKKFMPSTPYNKDFGLFGNPDDTEHALMRKVVSPIMSDRGVRERESLLLKHTKLFIEQLTRVTQKTTGGAVDMMHWYPRVTFDIVCDFVNSEDLGAVYVGISR